MRFTKKAIALWTALALMLVSAALASDVLRLPDATRIIGEEAFMGDTSLDQVVLPEGVTEIQARAFAGSSLQSITLARLAHHHRRDRL